MEIKLKDTSYKLPKTKTRVMDNIPLSSVPLSSNLSALSVPLDSSSFNNFNKKRPLKNNSQNLSFKGFFYKDVLDASKKAVKVFDRNEVLQEAQKHIGSTAQRLFNHLVPLTEEGSEAFSNLKLKKIVDNYISHKDGKVTFKTKTIPHLIYDGILYPFKILPADILNGTVSLLKKAGPLKNWAEGVYESQTFKNIRMRSKIESQINSLRGIFETADALKGKSLDERSSKFLQTSIKMFDSSKGKYDTKHERSFNRVVSGSIPAIFLANDAYNLSVMCNDNKEEASAEKKARFRQEVSRVITQAYITLITMGAISNYINKSKLAVMANVGLTALFTESMSRLSTGKFISKLTPEKAQEVNSKNKNSDKNSTDNSNKTVESQYKNVFFKSAENRKPFSSFAGAIPVLTADIEKKIKNSTPQVAKAESKPEAQGKEKQKAPLMSFNTLLKLVGGSVAVGFMMKGLRKNQVIDNLIQKSLAPFNKMYAKLTSEANHKISKKDFDFVVNKLRTTGFNELADKYIDVTKTYTELSVGKKLDKVLSLNPTEMKYNLLKLNDLGIEAKEKMIIELLNKYNASAGELKQAVKVLESNNLDNLAKEYKELIQKLESHKALMPETLNPASSNFDSSATAEKVAEVIKEYTDNIHLGKKDKQVVKPIVDFIIGPFKFIWEVAEGPYHWTNKLLNMATGQSPEALAKKAAAQVSKKTLSEVELLQKTFAELEKRNKADVTALGKSIEYIGKEANKKHFDNKVFTDFINDNIAKAFNIDTLSSVSNSDLANLSKTAVFAATIPFLMTDNYNMVMLKSNGKDKEGAELKAKERLVQEGSRFFYSTLLISLFNSTFKSQYNNSLMGMAWITAACTTIGEILNRKTVGVPVGTYSRDEIVQMEKDRENASPVAKKFYDFMARLTGKKSLAEQQKAKQQTQKA